MTTSLTTQYSGQLSWDHSWDDDDTGRIIRDQNSLPRIHDLAYGTGKDQCDLKFYDRRLVLNGANDDLDLSGGLTDERGAVLTFVRIKLIYIRNLMPTVGYKLNVGGAANPFASWLGNASDIVSIGPDGELRLFDPSAAAYAVTAGTGDILRISAVGGDITYDVLLFGASA